MENEKDTLDVIVHKANIPLTTNESLGEFTRTLGNAAKAFILQQLNVADGKGGGYIVEAYSGKVIVEIWRENVEPRYRFYKLDYSRDKNAVFQFSNLAEVKRTTVYKEAPTASKGMTASIVKSASTEDVHAWEPVQKSIFNGIV